MADCVMRAWISHLVREVYTHLFAPSHLNHLRFSRLETRKRVMTLRVEEIFHTVADLSMDARACYYTDHHIDVGIQREVEALITFDLHSGTSTLDREIGRVAMGTLARCEKQDL